MQQLYAGDTLDELIAQHEYSLLFFSASWCGPCRTMTPVVASIASLMDKRVNTIKIDVDKLESDLNDYGIRSVPSLLLIKQNEIIAQQVGALPAQQLLHWLESHI